jgi:hypothetical protein
MREREGERETKRAGNKTKKEEEEAISTNDRSGQGWVVL